MVTFKSLLIITITTAMIVIVAMLLPTASIIDMQDMQLSRFFFETNKYILSNSELTVPTIVSSSDQFIEKKPRATSTFSPGYGIVTAYQHTGFYKGSTEVLDISIKNTGENELFIYEYGVEPYGGKFNGYDTEMLIAPSEEKHIGFACIPIPSNTDVVKMKLGMGILAKDRTDSWYDYGLVFLEEVEIGSENIPDSDEIEYLYNTEPFFSAINKKIDPHNEDVRAVAAAATSMHPGEYSTDQLIALFDDVKNNIKYMSDPRGNDYWATPNETLVVKAGDCDDSAILLSSLIEAIGGTSRIYVTDTHMFVTAYIGKSEQATKVIETIEDHYGCVPIYYTTDEHGSWIIMDTTSGLYAGDLPAGAVPTTNGWKFIETKEVIAIDIIPS